MTRLSSGGLWRRRQERMQCQETLAHSDSLQPPQTCAAFSLMENKIRRYQAFGQWAHEEAVFVLSVKLITWPNLCFILHLCPSADWEDNCNCFHTLNQIWDQTFWNKDACFQACRLVLQLRKYDLWKMRMYMRGSVLWTILPAGLRQLTGSLFQPNPFLFTLWIIGQLARLPS